MMAVLRRLTLEGISHFVDYRDKEGKVDQPMFALTSPIYSEPLDIEIVVEDRDFSSRLDWARYIDEKMEGKRMKNVERDVGLWTWLSLFYVNRLLPSSKNGRKEFGEEAMWVLQNRSDHRPKYYRHLLAGPYRIY